MVDIFLGILVIILGVVILIYYFGLKKEEKIRGLVIKFLGAGIGLIMLGVTLILREISNN